jgi:hypothetical protein
MPSPCYATNLILCFQKKAIPWMADRASERMGAGMTVAELVPNTGLTGHSERVHGGCDTDYGFVPR